MVARQQMEQGSVLVVEDDESTALFVTRVLERGGLRAAWVSDAEQASALLDDDIFDVLLADYRLPGDDGVKLVAATRRRLPKIGIAVMTSFNEGGLERSARSSGADDFFEKPLRSSTLVARISALVSRSRAAGLRSPDASPERRACAMPAMRSQGVPVSDGISCAPPFAEIGPSQQPPRRGRGVAGGSTDRAGDTEGPRDEGPGDASWVRSSAFAPRHGDDQFGCEGKATEESPPGGPGAVGPGPFGRATHAQGSQMAHDGLRPGSASPLLLWATGAPDISVGSGVARVGYLNSTLTSTYFGD